jgi:hypothetical protein
LQLVKQLVSQLVLLQQESQQTMVVVQPIFEQSQQLVVLPPKLVKLVMLVVELLLQVMLMCFIKFSFIASLIALGSNWQQWHQPTMISKHQIAHLRRGSKSFEELLPLSLRTSSKVGNLML